MLIGAAPPTPSLCCCLTSRRCAGRLHGRHGGPRGWHGGAPSSPSSAGSNPDAMGACVSGPLAAGRWALRAGRRVVLHHLGRAAGAGDRRGEPPGGHAWAPRSATACGGALVRGPMQPGGALPRVPHVRGWLKRRARADGRGAEADAGAAAAAGGGWPAAADAIGGPAAGAAPT
jgi:hypothetical protein